MALRTLDIADGFASTGVPADIALPTGASTSANQVLQIAQETAINTNLGADITSPTAMPTGGVGVRGWLSAIWTKLNGSLTVTGTFWQATQPVSLASSVAVTGTFYQATQPVSIASMPTTAVTGTFYQATQPVSIAATVAVAAGTTTGTITQLRLTVGTTAVRATVAGTAPSASRKRLTIKPNKANTGAIYYGSSAVTTANGVEIIGPNNLDFLADGSDYYLISDTVSQTVELIEVV